MPAPTATPPAEPRPPAGEADDESRAIGPPRRGTAWLWRAGRTGWAVLGVVALIVLLGYLAGVLSLVVVPVVLALFPATLLYPVARWLKEHGVPPALAALAAILGALILFAAVISAMVPLVIAEVPALTRSAADGIAAFEEWLQRDPFGIEVDGLGDLLAAAQQQIGEVGDLVPQAVGAATTAFETLAGLVLLFVVLFFYLKDGPRLAAGLIKVLPDDLQERAGGVASRTWATLGSYLRWILFVALVDAVLIGVGLVILQVPLALPLAVLVFFGGLFPIVGAVVTGALAVLVALADAGLWIGLAVLAVVLVVQQLESNVLQPVVQSRAVQLHPLLVLLSVTAGAITLGILGAFLAVPAAAIVARTLRYLRGDDQEDRRQVERRRKAREQGEEQAAEVAKAVKGASGKGAKSE
jgi:putative heme transporter